MGRKDALVGPRARGRFVPLGAFKGAFIRNHLPIGAQEYQAQQSLQNT
jgi:hypothetical protein